MKFSLTSFWISISLAEAVQGYGVPVAKKPGDINLDLLGGLIYKSCDPVTITLPATTVTVQVPTTVTETVTVTPTPAPTCTSPTQALRNPGFEVDDEAWWIAGNRLAEGTRNTTDPYRGTYSIRSSGGDNQGRDWSLYLFQDEIAVCPGRTYQFQSFFRQDTIGNCRISAQVDETFTIAGPTPVAGTSWTLISGTYTVPADKTTITLFVRGDCTHTGPENGLWADEVTLTLTEQ